MADRPKRSKPKKLDNNNEGTSKGGGGSSKQLRGRHWPVLLHRGICQAAKERPDVIKWSKDGKAVMFEDKHPDLGVVLQKYLHYTRFDSLRRQMNVFGWKKARSGPFMGAFWCEGFHRDSTEEQLLGVLPPNVKGGSTARDADNDSNKKDTSGARLRSKVEPAVKKPDAKKPEKTPVAKKASPASKKKSPPSAGSTKASPSVGSKKTSPGSVGSKSSSRSRRSRSSSHYRSSGLNFLEFLHQAVTAAEKKYPGVIHWSKDGGSVMIDQFHKNIHQVLHKFFFYSSYDSLRRQMNVYGFHKEKGPSSPGPLAGFVRPGFHRDQPSYGAEESPYTQRTAKGGPAETQKKGDASQDDESFRNKKIDTFSDFESLRSRSLESLQSVERDDSTIASKVEDEIEKQDESEPEETEPTPEPKFQLYQKVYARDKDGIMYEAIIRRRLYGQNQQRQVFMGLASTEEADAMLEEDEEPTWHYFVHYNKWNVNWDRWVSEDDVYEPSDKIKEYAARLIKEHRALQQQMKKKQKGKKGWQTIDGVEFLRAWRKLMAKVDEEMQVPSRLGSLLKSGVEQVDQNPEDALAETKKPSRRTDTWTKAALGSERRLREKGLTRMRNQVTASKLALPFALKKVLVEQWEIIGQCRMMPCLPAPVTIRQALDQYLASKDVSVDITSSEKENGPSADTSAAQADTSDAMDISEEPKQASMPQFDDAENVETNPNIDNNATEDGKPAAQTEDEKRKQEWIEMADGIAMFFDEALPERLLYREELPQLRILDTFPEYSVKPYSEIYGCEHLLRMFVRLPEMLADELTESEARPIIAKVNDFVRFIHKNQTTLLTQSCRNLNDLELKEQQKLIKAEEKKRKRESEGTTEGGNSKKLRVSAD